jgi:hypothetical protein
VARARIVKPDTVEIDGLKAEIYSLKAEVESLKVNDEQLASRVRLLEKIIDTRATPFWKRILFRIDGWPSWATIADKPAWRPWRKWYTS